MKGLGDLSLCPPMLCSEFYLLVDHIEPCIPENCACLGLPISLGPKAD